jgi:hypothetical protein
MRMGMAVPCGIGHASNWLLLDQTTRFWAEDHLYDLYATGHLHRFREGGDLYYCLLASGARAGLKPAPTARPPHQGTHAYTPYTPAPSAPARAGSQAFAACPSLTHGKRLAWQPSLITLNS